MPIPGSSTATKMMTQSAFATRASGLRSVLKRIERQGGYFLDMWMSFAWRVLSGGLSKLRRHSVLGSHYTMAPNKRSAPKGSHMIWTFHLICQCGLRGLELEEAPMRRRECTIDLPSFRLFYLNVASLTASLGISSYS